VSIHSQNSATNTDAVVRLSAVRQLRAAQHAEDLEDARAALARGEPEPAAARLHSLLRNRTRDAVVFELLGAAYLQMGRTNEAISALSEALLEHPGVIGLHRLLHDAAIQARDPALAERCLAQIVRLDPADGRCLEQLADLQRREGLFEDAIVNYRRALDCNPALLGAYQNLSGCLIESGRLEEAAAVAERGALRFSRLPELHYNLGLAYDRLHRHEAAAAAYERALERSPRYVKALNNLGNVLRVLGRLDEAEARAANALCQEPDLWAGHVNLGNVLKAQGRLDASRRAYRHAAAVDPDQPVSWSNLAGLLPYFAERDDDDEAHVLRRFNATISPAPVQRTAASRVRRANSKRVRIGYVSADFRRHVCMYYVEPVLEHHDRSRFDIFCYDNTAVADSVSARLRKLDCTWRSIIGMTDDQAAAQIRADGIDVLVDLMGHTVGNRLGIFARRAAPVQMTWQGFPGSTGLTTMDYWITDRQIARGDCLQDYRTESFLTLPDFERCFRPDPDAPAVQPAPCGRDGTITFGSFSAVYKLNDDVLGVWTELLHRVPRSRLLMVSVPAGKAQLRIERYFRTHGIAEHRVRIVPHIPLQEYLKLHGEIDLMLDPFPYNGVTTTLQSLWMGVPVLTMKGARYPTRVGASILANAGLHSLIATNATEYVQKACELAQDSGRLDRLRATMRARLSGSPLLDEQRFTRALESLYLDASAATRSAAASASEMLADDGWLKLY
jgi:protein O-GlcNAc transferase